MADVKRGRVQARFMVDGNDASSGDLGAFSEVRVRLPDNGPARFEATFLDANPNLDIQTSFATGQPVEVHLGYQDEPPIVFTGEVTTLRYRGQKSSVLNLMVEGADRLHRLSRGVHQRLHVDVTDKDVVSKCLQEGDLEPGEVEDTGIIYPSIAQYNQNNLEFLMDRARRLGFCLWADEGKAHFGPRGTGDSAIDLTVGSDISFVQVRQTVAHTASSVEIRGWDMAKKDEQVAKAEAGQEDAMNPSGAAATDAAGAFVQGVQTYGTVLPRSQKEAELIAKGQLTRRSFAFAVGEVTCIGDPSLKPGGQVEIKGLGPIEAGIYHIGEVYHRWLRKAGPGEESFTTQLKLRRNFVNSS